MHAKILVVACVPIFAAVNGLITEDSSPEREFFLCETEILDLGRESGPTNLIMKLFPWPLNRCPWEVSLRMGGCGQNWKHPPPAWEGTCTISGAL